MLVLMDYKGSMESCSDYILSFDMCISSDANNLKWGYCGTTMETSESISYGYPSIK